MSEKNGFVRKIGTKGAGYIKRRFGNEFITRVGRESVTSSYSAAKEAIQPARVSRNEIEKGLEGRYKDGGRERFSQLAKERHLSSETLDIMAQRHKTNACLIGGAAVFTLGIGTWSIFTSSGSDKLVAAALTLVISMLFGAFFMRFDFSRWQIENRRFGGFREYLQSRDFKPKRKTSLPMKRK
jgi:hypothetical protein